MSRDHGPLGLLPLYRNRLAFRISTLEEFF